MYKTGERRQTGTTPVTQIPVKSKKTRSFIDGKSILITGGTGSFGKTFISRLLSQHNPRRVVDLLA